jgi:hypothetical protein
MPLNHGDTNPSAPVRTFAGVCAGLTWAGVVPLPAQPREAAAARLAAMLIEYERADEPGRFVA